MKLWQELSRRRVYRLAGLYIVGAWLAIQVADISFPAWGVPEAALRYLFIAAAAGFPVALVFGWFYDITASGIVRTEAATSFDTVDLSLKRTDYIVLAALLAVGIAILLGSANKIQDEIESVPAIALETGWRENSIAVLPFTNLDTNPDTGFFSDGVTEEILYRLSSLGALHVLAANSSFAFRDSEQSPIQIREKLGVRYLLQGSIRRDKEYVRITARLVDEGGFQIWSESFERKLESIFSVQTEIASTVASQIVNEIVPLRELPAGRTTTNMQAYDEYLVGRSFLDARTADWQDQAIAAFRRAIDLDSGFAPPHAGLAMALTVNSGPGPQWDEGRQLAEKALQLDPDLARAHAALGLILMSEGKLPQSVLSSRRALELDPSLSFSYNILGAALSRLGREDEAKAALDNGLAVDPLNPPSVENVANRESSAGNFERAEQLILRLQNLPEPPYRAYLLLHQLYWDWGRLSDGLLVSKEEIRRYASQEDAWIFESLADFYSRLGMREEADYWANIVLSRVPDDWRALRFKLHLSQTRSAESELATQLRKLINDIEPDDESLQVFDKYFLALISIQLGKYEQGIELMKSSVSLDVETLDRNYDTGDVIITLHRVIFAYQQMGRTDEARVLLEDMERLGYGIYNAVNSNPPAMESIALHRVLKGDAAGALQALRSAKASGWAIYFGLINDPAWAETIKAPEFQELLGEVKEEVDRQREIVEADDAEQDFRAEIAALLGDEATDE